MRRKLLPWIVVFLAAMLDTTVIPMLIQGPYVVPLTGLCVICISFLAGRLYGLLFGLFGGILLDVTSGSLGERLFPYLVIGYLLGLILDGSDLRKRQDSTYFAILLRRLLFATAFSLAAELAIYFYQYFHTAQFEWVHILNCAIRAAISGVASQILLPVLGRLFIGNPIRKSKGGDIY